jgi:arylsulfatase
MPTPNILWFCADQQRYDTIHSLNNPHIRTPNIDRLVAEGIAFTHAFCQSPICTPSRASFLTGRYPSSVHNTRNGNERWSEAAPLVTKLLRDGAGYDCGLVGKLHLTGTAGREEPRPADDGYRVFHWSHDPEDRYPSGHAYADWLAAQGLSLKEMRKNPAAIPPHLHQTTWCTDRAIDFLREEREGPWLMSVNVFDPHAPFDPPQEYLDRYDPASMPPPLFRESDLVEQLRNPGDFQNPARRPETFDAQQIIAAYYAMIELIDDNLGRLLDALAESGQREDTIVIFTSDHGEMLGDHGLLLKGCRFFDGLVRVPLVMSWPGHFPGGVVSDALVELTDLAPTLLDAAGLPIPEEMAGRSLLPLLLGDTPPDSHREFVRCEYYQALNATAPGRTGWTGSYATMLRNHQYKLVVYHGEPYGELYDLAADPGEFDNRWDDPAYAEIRFDLLRQSFDALAFAVDVGSEQTLAF